VQGSLFLRADDRRRVTLMLAIDAFNRRYGRDRVRFAGTGLDRAWKLRADFHSPPLYHTVGKDADRLSCVMALFEAIQNIAYKICNYRDNFELSKLIPSIG
jgi:hypothetical protein